MEYNTCIFVKETQALTRCLSDEARQEKEGWKDTERSEDDLPEQDWGFINSAQWEFIIII